MTSPKPEHSPWPSPPSGLLKGEVYAFMSPPPKKLSPEELEEFELRAYALIRRRGVIDLSSPQRWRRDAIVFETDYLQLVNQGHQFVARVCDRRPMNPSGIMLYQQAWLKNKATNAIDHRYELAKVALQHMRDLMVLEDLANL